MYSSEIYHIENRNGQILKLKVVGKKTCEPYLEWNNCQRTYIHVCVCVVHNFGRYIGTKNTQVV